MNILYVLGNGFDLNLGLKTSYEDFFEYYKNQPSENTAILNLKENIKGKKKDWSDLELTLGSYFKELSTEEEFDFIFDDIKFHLSRYLYDQESKFNIDKIDQSIFIEYLINPDKELLLSDQIDLKAYFSKWRGKEINIEIATFNYTRIIDRLLKDKFKKNPLGKRKDGSIVKLSRILHVHGFVDKNMVLGVNDEMQILNNDFKSNHYIKSSFIKEECNGIFKNEVSNYFKSQIKKADLIIIFGCSLGDTDKIWWERISSKLNDNSRLIIFKKGPKIHPLQEHKLFKYENQIKDYFFEKAGNEDVDKINFLKERVYVGINSNMFNFIPFLNE